MLNGEVEVCIIIMDTVVNQTASFCSTLLYTYCKFMKMLTIVSLIFKCKLFYIRVAKKFSIPQHLIVLQLYTKLITFSYRKKNTITYLTLIIALDTYGSRVGTSRFK